MSPRRANVPKPTEEETLHDKYFYSTFPWGSPTRHPSPAGSLAQDNYDPTFGDNGVSIGADVYQCLVCGAVVLDWRKHIDWHENAS